MELFQNLKLSQRFAALIAIFTLGFVVFGVWSFMTLNELKVNGPHYLRIVHRLRARRKAILISAA